MIYYLSEQITRCNIFFLFFHHNQNRMVHYLSELMSRCNMFFFFFSFFTIKMEWSVMYLRWQQGVTCFFSSFVFTMIKVEWSIINLKGWQDLTFGHMHSCLISLIEMPVLLFVSSWKRFYIYIRYVFTNKGGRGLKVKAYYSLFWSL